MKKISIIALMLGAFFTTSCENDATLEETRVADISAPSVTMNVSVNQYDATFDIALSSLGEPAAREYGVMYSTETQPTVDNSQFVAAEDITTTNSTITVNLMPGTTYYACGYALTANQLVTSEVKSFTTEKAPEFEDKYLFGTYTAVDFDITTGEQASNPYNVTIEQKDGMYNKVYIHNIWEGELAIVGTVDFVNKTITTDPNSVVYVHSSYGDVWAWGMNVVDGQLGWNSECVTIATYDENGKVDFGYWGARCSAGAFGYYLTKMVKQ